MNRKLIFAGAVLSGALVIAGCSAGSQGNTGKAQRLEQQQAGEDNLALITNQPLPHYSWSQIRETLITAENISANGSQTTSFFFNQGVQNPVWSCPSIGLPVANTAELDNPQQNYNSGYPQGGTSYPISQMDPNGIYTPQNSTGTYVICVNGSGQKYVAYWEGFVYTVSAPAIWNNKTHEAIVTGAPSVTVPTKGGSK